MQRGIFPFSLYFECLGFGDKVFAQQFRQYFYKKYHTDHSERIGDAIGDGSGGGVRAVDRDGKTWRTGQRPSDQSDEARRIDSDHIFKYQTGKAGRSDNQKR